jgi:hypothetical protein
VEGIVHVIGPFERRECCPVGSQDVIGDFDKMEANVFGGLGQSRMATWSAGMSRVGKKAPI